MRKIKTLVVAFVLGLASAAYASNLNDSYSIQDKASCCSAGAACCDGGSCRAKDSESKSCSMHKQGEDCCKPGAACCDGGSCCAAMSELKSADQQSAQKPDGKAAKNDKASCCSSGSACCDGGSCCAKHKAGK
ncbi:MAG: hypothetical protein AB7U82_01595 [Blastocatellales bacterium]